jgi:hypothetical protein
MPVKGFPVDLGAGRKLSDGYLFMVQFVYHGGKGASYGLAGLGDPEVYIRFLNSFLHYTTLYKNM